LRPPERASFSEFFSDSFQKRPNWFRAVLNLSGALTTPFRSRSFPMLALMFRPGSVSLACPRLCHKKSFSVGFPPFLGAVYDSVKSRLPLLKNVFFFLTLFPECSPTPSRSFLPVRFSGFFQGLALLFLFTERWPLFAVFLCFPDWMNYFLNGASGRIFSDDGRSFFLMEPILRLDSPPNVAPKVVFVLGRGF